MRCPTCIQFRPRRPCAWTIACPVACRIAVLATTILLLAACWGESPTPTPAAAPATGLTVAPGSAPAPGDVSSGPTVPASAAAAAPGATQTLAATAALAPGTPAPTAPAAATTSAALLKALTEINVRGGPGLNYPVIGSLVAGEAITITGKSADGLWWQIACPPSVPRGLVPAQGGGCWSIGGEYVDVAAAGPIAVAAVPPTPTVVPLTATPTPEPCVVSPPGGWRAYTVAAGDTLSSLATQRGTTIAQLQAVNCLEGDVIVSGLPLYVPAAQMPAAGQGTVDTQSDGASIRGNFLPVTPMPAGSTGAAGNSATSVTDTANTVTLDASILGDFLSPNFDNCVVPGIDPTPAPLVSAGIRFSELSAEFEVGQLVCIFAQGFTDPAALTITVQPPGIGDVQALEAKGGIARWQVALQPNAVRAEPYRIVVADDRGNTASTQVTVNSATVARLVVPPGIYARGAPVPLVLAHVPVGAYALVLFQYQEDPSLPPYRPYPVLLPFIFAGRDANGFGSAAYQIDTAQLESGAYAVSLGDYDARFANPLWRVFEIR